jgi:hypothetical protein
MTMIHKPSLPLLVLLFASPVFGVLLAPRAAAQTNGETIVALNPGVCSQISDGGLVTLEWNPAFDSPAEVSGIKELVLYFARDEDQATVRHHDPPLVLHATNGHLEGPSIPQPIKAASNGFFDFTFRANLHGVPPGTYKLTRALAAAITSPDFQGTSPQMTNDPSHSSFCVVVDEADGHNRAQR